MKKFIPFIALLASLLFSACTKSQPEFIVKGTTSQDRLNGQRVFLVPYGSKQIEDSIGVDSVVIENNQFEFRGKGEYLARVTIDKHVRYGTQDLLIITESGAPIIVEIDSVSHGGGTPQNEALEKWKGMKIAHDAFIGPKVVEAYNLRMRGDSAAAQAISDTLKIYNDMFKKEVLDIARILGSGPAYDLLMSRYGN